MSGTYKRSIQDTEVPALFIKIIIDPDFQFSFLRIIVDKMAELIHYSFQHQV